MTKKLFTRKSRCRRKITFGSIGSAQAFAARRLLKQIAYRCNCCGQYHLTTAKAS